MKKKNFYCGRQSKKQVKGLEITKTPQKVYHWMKRCEVSTNRNPPEENASNVSSNFRVKKRLKSF